MQPKRDPTTASRCDWKRCSFWQAAITAHPTDPKAAYYLGNLLRDRRRHQEAIELWERSAQLDRSFSVVWRNLGIAYFNVLGNTEKARAAFDKAIQINPHDARVFYERDQLWKRIGETPENRLEEFQTFAGLVSQRDDLSLELASLYNQTGQHEKALALLQARRFQPWEGGEGLVLGQHVSTHLALGRRALRAGDAIGARILFEAALGCPENLGEATHLLANQSDIFYWLGVACEAAGEFTVARKWWERATRHKGDFQGMSVKSFSEVTYYSGLALKRLGRVTEAHQLLHELLQYGDDLARQTPKSTTSPRLFQQCCCLRMTCKSEMLWPLCFYSPKPGSDLAKLHEHGSCSPTCCFSIGTTHWLRTS